MNQRGSVELSQINGNAQERTNPPGGKRRGCAEPIHELKELKKDDLGTAVHILAADFRKIHSERAKYQQSIKVQNAAKLSKYSRIFLIFRFAFKGAERARFKMGNILINN